MNHTDPHAYWEMQWNSKEGHLLPFWTLAIETISHAF